MVFMPRNCWRGTTAVILVGAALPRSKKEVNVGRCSDVGLNCALNELHSTRAEFLEAISDDGRDESDLLWGLGSSYK